MIGVATGLKANLMNARSILPMKNDISQIQAIIRVVASKWDISPELITGRVRRQPISFARQLCMALAYQKTNFSLNQVGECFDNRDHGTVIHAIKKVDQASNDKEIEPIIREIIREIGS